MPAARPAIRPTAARLAVTAVILLVAACGGSSATTAPSTTAVPTASGAAASVAVAATATPAPTAAPTRAPLPTALPRPSDLPLDGTCETGSPCLGLLKAGAYHSHVFSPGFAFTVATADWENRSEEGGIFGLESIRYPGDIIIFFRHPDPTTPTGASAGIDISVGAIQAWLTANHDLALGPIANVKVGGLSGIRTDVTIAPASTVHPSDCPVVACVSMFVGKDKNWNWDWGTVSSERQRMYLLTAKDGGVVAIFVDSLDGSTFDALTEEADAIISSVRFDPS